MTFQKMSPETLGLVIKVLRAIKTDPTARQFWADSNWGCETVNDRQFINATGNHLFDDSPEPFGITEHEGHCIRAYFQTNGTSSNVPFYEYVQSIIEEVWREVPGT